MFIVYTPALNINSMKAGIGVYFVSTTNDHSISICWVKWRMGLTMDEEYPNICAPTAPSS